METSPKNNNPTRDLDPLMISPLGHMLRARIDHACRQASEAISSLERELDYLAEDPTLQMTVRDCDSVSKVAAQQLDRLQDEVRAAKWRAEKWATKSEAAYVAAYDEAYPEVAAKADAS